MKHGRDGNALNNLQISAASIEVGDGPMENQPVSACCQLLPYVYGDILALPSS